MLRRDFLAKKLTVLRTEETALRTRQADLATREAEVAGQIRAAENDADLAAAEAAVAEVEQEVATVRERLTAVAEEINEIVAQIDEAEAAAATAAAAVSGDDTRSRRSSAAFQRRCADFLRTGRMIYENARSLITRAATTTASTGVIGPTGVGGINDDAGSNVSGFIDMITVTDCTGMASYKVALVTGDPSAAAGTDGTSPAQSSTAFDSVELTGKLYNLIDYVSAQIRKWSPLNYEAKIQERVRKALRAVLSKMVITKILASKQNSSMEITGATGAALFTPNLLSDIILAYGGDEGVDGAGCLVLPKADLKAFAAVRGKNEYLPVYSIVPDASNPSMGIIKDNNGLSCRYCLSKDVPALSTATLSTSGIKGMFYGNPKCAEMGLWGGIDVLVNEGYKFAEGLLTIKGEVTADAEVTVKNGFVVVTAKSA